MTENEVVLLAGNAMAESPLAYYEAVRKLTRKAEIMARLGARPTRVEVALARKELLGVEYSAVSTRLEKKTKAQKKRKKPKKLKKIRFDAMQKRLSRATSGKCADDIRSEFGYSVDDVRRHMEKQFSRGMTWANYAGNLPWKSTARKWHIDHIIPKSRFHLSDAVAAFALSNLRPLWEKDNLQKGQIREHLI